MMYDILAHNHAKSFILSHMRILNLDSSRAASVGNAWPEQQNLARCQQNRLAFAMSRDSSSPFPRQTVSSSATNVDQETDNVVLSSRFMDYSRPRDPLLKGGPLC